jgi:methionyl-tRNA formyltransferase
MVKELDAGNVIYQKKIALEPKETYRSLYDKLSTLAYEVLREQIQTLFDKNLKSIPQDTTKVTIAKNISRDDEKIN